MTKENPAYIFPIPGYIQNEIDKKGFYIYEWVDEQELKASIERDFLKIFDKIGYAIAFLLIVPSALFYFASGITGLLTVYFLLITFFSIIIFFYILYLSIQRSLLLRKISFIIITNNYFRILNDIQDIRDNALYGDKKLLEIGELFEEQLFRNSSIKKNRKALFAKVKSNLVGGYSFINSLFEGRSYNVNNGKNSTQLILLLYILYTIYLASVGLLYIIGIILVLLIGKLFATINRKVLLLRKNNIIRISESFEILDDYSKNIEAEKNLFLNSLKEAQNNNWMDGLFLDLERQITDINFYAKNSLEESTKLYNLMKTSEFQNMFDYKIFGNWLKDSITSPLKEVQNLLKINLKTIEKALLESEKLIEKYENSKQSAPIELSKKRLEIRKDELQKQIVNLDFYIKKLES